MLYSRSSNSGLDESGQPGRSVRERARERVSDALGSARLIRGEDARYEKMLSWPSLCVLCPPIDECGRKDQPREPAPARRGQPAPSACTEMEERRTSSGVDVVEERLVDALLAEEAVLARDEAAKRSERVAQEASQLALLLQMRLK